MTKLTKKQECIRKAYGKYWEIHKDNVDENGWSYLGNNTRLLNDYNCSLVGEWQQKGYDPFKTGENSHIQQVYVRPKSLEGIEDNNGWISIEEHGLPKEDGRYDVILDGGYQTDWMHTANVTEDYWKERVTHYKPIEQPKLPLY